MRFTYGVILAVLLWIPVTGFSEEKTPASWYDRTPKLAVMTGFIYEPLKPYTLQQWAKGLGDEFDADRWVADFKETGASYLIFYDKWIDGFVFHDTKTTGFKTDKDFVGELADACHKGELPLVLYFNAMTDGNPEFDKWSLVDRRGTPLVFSRGWPTRVQTLHSPFREISIRQVQEIFTNYGRIDGLWFDIFHDRGLQSTSPFVPKGFEKMYGKPLAKATNLERAEFPLRTLADYLDDVRALARKHQPHCVLTANGSAARNLRGGGWVNWVGSRLDYGSVEGHQIGRIEQLARGAWAGTMPTEIGLLLNTSWFTPLKGKAPPAKMTRKHAIAATAMGVCQGASIYLALTPDHSGVFGDDLKLAKQVGAWFKTVEPSIKGARPYADVGIVLGALDEAFALRDALEVAGVFGEILYDSKRGGNWPKSLSHYRAMTVTDPASLDETHAEQIRQYVKKGGRLMLLDHGSMFDAQGNPRKDFALADVLAVKHPRKLALPVKSERTKVKTDSAYSREFVAGHLVDGAPTAWASGDTPMPHWAEIILPGPADVAKVELVSRSGPYLVTDIDVSVHDGNDWKTVKSVRGADKRTILVSLDKPLRASRVRVTILRELYEGKDRQYADVESIRLIDKAGRDCSTDRTAGPSIIFRNRYGQGEAIVVAASDGAFRKNSPSWTELRQLIVGEPTITLSDGALSRYRFVLTRVGQSHVLHAIDRTAGGGKYKAAEVTVSLRMERLGNPGDAILLGGMSTLKTEQNGKWMTLVLRPDPVASVVLRQ